MFRIFKCAALSAILFLLSFLSAAGQTQDASQIYVDGDVDEYIKGEKRWLRGDLKIADVVAHVDVSDAKFADRTGEEADCDNNQGSGYCTYLLTAEVKEFFKGASRSKKLEFYVGAEVQYPKKNFIGEQIVFLIRNENEKTGQTSLGTIENSTRRIDVLEEMRKIVDPNAKIDDTDDSEPYSTQSLALDFEDADAVVYADATAFSAFTDFLGIDAFLVEASIIETYKGEFKAKQKIRYKEDLLHRPVRREDLGRQILFLKKVEEDGQILYERIRNTVTAVEHDALEKLKKIARKK